MSIVDGPYAKRLQRAGFRKVATWYRGEGKVLYTEEGNALFLKIGYRYETEIFSKLLAIELPSPVYFFLPVAGSVYTFVFEHTGQLWRRDGRTAPHEADKSLTFTNVTNMVGLPQRLLPRPKKTG